MNLKDFLASVDVANRPPAGLAETLRSLWWDKKGDWERAHAIAQEIPSVQGSAVHAYLHREEGVLWNADYWYRRAGRTRPGGTTGSEWEGIVAELLGGDA